jgi:hypothetical protein
MLIFYYFSIVIRPSSKELSENLKLILLIKFNNTIKIFFILLIFFLKLKNIYINPLSDTCQTSSTVNY